MENKRIWLDEKYAIHKYKNLKLWYLEYYRYGKDHIPDELFADEDYNKVYKKYQSIIK